MGFDSNSAAKKEPPAQDPKRSQFYLCTSVCHGYDAMPFQSFDLLLTWTTLFTHVPIPSSPTSTMSPSRSHSGGFRPAPTPWGLLGFSNVLWRMGGIAYVPVKIKSPGKSVVPCERKAIVCATPNIISLVDDSWTVFPFSLVEMFRFCGSLMRLEETIPGPNGAHPSNPFPRAH